MKNATVINCNKAQERKQLPPFPFLLIETATLRVWITTRYDGLYYISPIGDDHDRNIMGNKEDLLSGKSGFRLPEPGEKIVIEY